MKVVLLGIFQLFFLSLLAQQKPAIALSGTIKDASSLSPLPGASIQFIDARIGTIADSNGQYVLHNVPPGHHLIEVTHASYSSVVEHIDISVSTMKDFLLSSEIVENQGVTVTGVSTATSTRNTPIPVTLIRKSDLLQTTSTNIIDALSHLPGISQIGTGPAVSKPVIRGLSYNRVVVVNDGLRQEGQQWGDEHGIEIDEYSVVRAEVLKGPASIMYGSDALAGVVHFITNVPAPEGMVRGNTFFNYQTNNNQGGMHLNVQGNQNGFNWNAYGSMKSARDYQNKYDGRVLNSRFNEGNYGGYIGLNKSWGYSHLIFSNFHQNVGLVEGERHAATGEFLVNPETSLERIATPSDYNSRSLFFPNQQVRHYKIISDNSFGIGKHHLKLNVGWQKNLRNEFGNPELPEERELAFDLHTLNYNVQWRIPERNEWQITLGMTGMQQQNKNEGGEVIIPEYNSSDLGGFAYLQKSLSKLTFSGGLRYDNRNIHSKALTLDGQQKFLAFRRSFQNISGSAGVSYFPTEIITVKANIAKGFRAPSLSELASNGAHEGTNRYEYGQLDLNSENSLQFDAGLDIHYDHLSLSFAGFYNDLNDFIFYQRLQNQAGNDSIVMIDGEELEAFQFSQQHAKLSGLEFTIDLHPHPLDWLHFENSFSLVRGRFKEKLDGSDRLPLMPAARWISQLKANFTKSKKTFRNFYMHVEVDKTFKQDQPFTGYNTETATSGYALLNAGLGTDVYNRKTNLFSLHFVASNLMDAAYQNHLNRLKYTAENAVTGRQGVYNMGRNFSFKVNVPFSFIASKK